MEGEYQSQHEVIRPVRKYKQLRDYARLKRRITELRKQDWTMADIAGQLNKEGFCYPITASSYPATASPGCALTAFFDL